MMTEKELLAAGWLRDDKTTTPHYTNTVPFDHKQGHQRNHVPEGCRRNLEQASALEAMRPKPPAPPKAETEEADKEAAAPTTSTRPTATKK